MYPQSPDCLQLISPILDGLDQSEFNWIRELFRQDDPTGGITAKKWAIAAAMAVPSLLYWSQLLNIATICYRAWNRSAHNFLAIRVATKLKYQFRIYFPLPFNLRLRRRQTYYPYPHLHFYISGAPMDFAGSTSLIAFGSSGIGSLERQEVRSACDVRRRLKATFWNARTNDACS